MFKKLLKFILLILILSIGYLLFWPVEFKPNAWYFAPGPEMTGVLTPNNKLASAQPFGPKLSRGVEDLAFDKEGNIYTASYFGDKLHKISADGSKAEVMTNIPKHSLGISVRNNGKAIYIINATEGLLKVENNKITTLLKAVEDKPIMFGEEISIAKNGMVYFSDGSKYPITSLGVVLDREPSGRVLSYDAKTGIGGLIVGGIDFANGITLSHDEKSIIIAEFNQGRLLRYWIEGPKTGRLEKFVDPLPGMPDNISRGENGIYWVALFTTRDAMQQLSQSPLRAKIAQRLPHLIREKLLEDKKSMVLGINDQGQIVHFLQDSSQSQTNITSVVERDGYLYLGGLYADQLRRIKVPNGKSPTIATPAFKQQSVEKQVRTEKPEPTEKQNVENNTEKPESKIDSSTDQSTEQSATKEKPVKMQKTDNEQQTDSNELKKSN